MAIVINPSLYVVGQNSAMWLDFATTSAMKVLGLQGMGLGIGFTQQSQDVAMMGVRIAPKVFTGATYDEMSVAANFIPGDPSQEALQQAALEGTLLKNIRLYLKDGCHFSAPDQVSADGGLVSGTSGMNVGSYTDPQIGSPSDLYTNNVSFAPAGPFAVFVAHTDPGDHANITVLSEATNSGAATIELLDSVVWDTLGFEDGDTIIVDHNGSTPKYAKIASGVATDTITLTLETGDSTSLADGALTTGGAVHGATPMAASAQSATC